MRLTHTSAHPRDHLQPSDNRLILGTDTMAPHAALRPGASPRCPADTGNTPPTSEVRGGARRSIRHRALLVAGQVVVALVSSAAIAHAEPVVLAIAGSVDQVLTNIRNWLMGILAGLATVFLTIGGIRRVFGGGDPGEQEKSKECFKSAGWGYALAALAPLVVEILKGIVGA